MKKMRKLLCLLLILPLCGFASIPSPKEEISLPLAGALPLENRYIEKVADEVLQKILSPGMQESEQAQAAYRWVIENTFFTDPIGQDIWRYRGNAQQQPGYVENRALSPLLFGAGYCEDYASALVILLRRMGIEAQYVAGLTISVNGDFVDHAWTAAKVDGQWYHLDCQLEQNVLREGKLTYRYFLKNDSYLLADHRWGNNLCAYYGNPQNEAQEEILSRWTPPPCTAVLKAPAAETVRLPEMPDRVGIERKLLEERSAYIRRYGPLPLLTLDLAPPPVYLNDPDWP
ncbi:MAG: transglutaminase domain-containing protein [Provencibacterium sp.]|nr:transglutaminase domain-containing protein [Provencibacterium sp.]